jgi:hypothetical protein
VLRDNAFDLDALVLADLPFDLYYDDGLLGGVLVRQTTRRRRPTAGAATRHVGLPVALTVWRVTAVAAATPRRMEAREPWTS